MPGRVALLLQNPLTGGVARAFSHLARGFCDHGVSVELIVVNADSPFVQALDPRVRLARLAPGEDLLARLCRHLSDSQPLVLMASKEDCALAVAAKRLLADPPRVFLRLSAHVSSELVSGNAGPIKRWQRYRWVRNVFSEADHIICVSGAVAQDLGRILRRDPGSFSILPNPSVPPELAEKARAPLDHPWFAPGQPPVVLGVGRLGRVKNFPMLVRAVAHVRRRRDCRVVILGEGKYHAKLTTLARQLGVADALDLPGFSATPYAYMARAAIYASTARSEASSNALIEAMACGTPVVATDCPGGTRELLRDGELGPLVPIDDDVALSEAILWRLQQPRDAERLRAAVAKNSVENSSRAYLQAFGLLR